jgi:hypothetical protein
MSFNDGFNIRAVPWPPNTPVSGNSLVYNGTQWVAQNVSGSGGGGSGDITAVYAGTNLTGGGDVGDVTVSLSASITGLTNVQTTALSASHISGSDLKIDYIDFISGSNPAFKTGRLHFNVDNGDLSYDTNVSGVYLNYGQQLAVKVKNNTGASIAKGKLVSISGGLGNNPTVTLANWDSEKLSADTIGMMMNTAGINEFAYVLINGVIEDVNTSGYNGGTTLYLSSSGNYTSTAPVPPKQAVRIGHVVREQTNNGSIFINVQNGYEINELHDVLISSSANGDLLVWDSSLSLWKNTKTLSGSYTVTGSITASNISASNLVTSTDGTIVADRVLLGSGSNIATATGELVFFNPGSGNKTLKVTDPSEVNYTSIEANAIDVQSGGNLDIGASNAGSISIGNFLSPINVSLIGNVLIDYTPAVSGDWNGTPPTKVGEALDRIAALLKALNGGTGP